MNTPIAKRRLVLFDIDGVVADDSHRVEFARNKNWGAYFELADKDAPLDKGRDLVFKELHEPNTEVQYLTGRRIDLYAVTYRWLRRHGFPNEKSITMRGFAHRDILAKYKAGVIRNAIEGNHFSSVLLYEDDPAVVEYVNAQFGEGTAILCDWYTKHPDMIKHANA